MSWENTRGGAVETVRRTAYSDDAKDRSDEVRDVHRVPRRGVRALAPALVAGVVVLLVAGGGTVAWVSTRGESSQSQSQGPGANPADATIAAPSEPEAVTVLPLEPTDQDVAYAGAVRCVEAGDFFVGACPSVFQGSLTCPEGLCTINFFVRPEISSSGGSGVDVTFRAGDPVVQYSGPNGTGGPCQGTLEVDGTRQPDGGYQIRFVNGSRAGELDGSCSPPSDTVFDVVLTPPA